MTNKICFKKIKPAEDINRQYSAVIKEDGDWWIGWIEEIPGVNCQEKNQDELIISLKTTLKEALELNKKEAIMIAGNNYQKVLITI